MKFDDRNNVTKIYGFTHLKMTEFTEIFELKFVLIDEIWAVIFEIS